MDRNLDHDNGGCSFEGIIGVSRKDISPPPNIYARNWGAALHDAAEGIHRSLVLVCQTFRSAEADRPLVLISADLGWWKNMEDEQFVREGILNALGLEAWQLLFCLSHTHAGPGMCREDESKPGGEYIEPYLKHIQQMAIEAVLESLASAKPAFLTWKYGTCTLATNRDLPAVDSDRILVGYNPEAAADDTLLVGRITAKDGSTIGTIVNYACHPTTLAWENKLISPDYVGAMRELVEESTDAPCLFLQGASGELAPAEQYSVDCALADSHGLQLGYSVLSVLQAMLPANRTLSFNRVVESGAPLALWKQFEISPLKSLLAKVIEVEFPLKHMASVEEIEQEWEECADRVLKERLWRKRCIRKALGKGETTKIPLWIWNLGGTFLIGQPNEAYSDFQLQLRRQLKPREVAVVNIVNGYFGYLPPEQLYDKDMYAVWQTPFAKGALEMLIESAYDAAMDMISDNKKVEK